MPDKVTISHRGARYEIGRGKRYYGIWVTGAPESDPVDRWPETPDGWAQAWTRFVAMETPGTITSAEKPRPALSRIRLPRRPKGLAVPGGPGGQKGIFGGNAAIAAAALVGLGVVLSIAGLFPGYFGSQSLASQSEDLVPHLFYLVGWAVSGGLILAGRVRAGRGGMIRVGALLGTGLSVVTLGLFLSDLGQVISGPADTRPGLGAGMVISIIGWAACAAGSVTGLGARAQAKPAGVALAADTALPTGTALPADTITPADTPMPGTLLSPDDLGMPSDTIEHGDVPPIAQTPPAFGVGQPSGADQPDGVYDPWSAGQPSANPPGGVGQPGAGSAGQRDGAARHGRLVRPRPEHAGPVTLLVLAALGAVAAFAPSWDSYTLQAATGSQTITLGNAFSNPGPVIAGDVIVMVAVVLVALGAALWHPMRQGAALLAGAIVPMAGQAVSALIQVSQPTSPLQFGITPAQASAANLTITAGVTPVFWVYCVFIIALAISCAWLVTEPVRPAAHAPAPASWPGPQGGPQGGSQSGPQSGPEGGPEGNTENSYA